MDGTWKVNQGLAGVSGITLGCVLIDAVEDNAHSRAWRKCLAD